MIELDLPFPPSTNDYYRSRVCSILAASGVRPFDGPLAVQIEVYPPDNQRRDLDNTMKALLDALQHGGAYRDDSQIVCLVIEKRSPLLGGKMVVHIRQTERR